MMNFMARITAVIGATWLLAHAGGCEVFDARSAVSADFHADRANPVAAIIENSEGQHSSAGVLREVEDTFMHNLLEKGYTIASRSDVRDLVREAEFQRGAAMTDRGAVRLGRMLNVPVVLIVTVVGVPSGDMQPRFHRRPDRAAGPFVGARLVDVETGQILWSASDSDGRFVEIGIGPANADGADGVRSAASRVAQAFPIRHSAAGE